MAARNCRITLEDYCREKGIDFIAAHDLKVEGTFHPSQDLTYAGSDEKVAHFQIKGLLNWGQTRPRMPMVPATPEALLTGYYHDHKGEWVYLKPIGKPGAADGTTLIPCYEYNVAIEGDWDKYSR